MKLKLTHLSAFLLAAASAVATPQTQPRHGDDPPAGLSRGEWQSVTAAYQAFRHRFEEAEDDSGLTYTRQHQQQFTGRFDGRSFEVSPDAKIGDQAWIWGLSLSAYGLGEASEPLAPTALPATQRNSPRENELHYQHNEILREWWHNKPEGLEHGWTLSQRPAGPAKAKLHLRLKTLGALKPKPGRDAQSLSFADEKGEVLLHYAGLKAWDAKGRQLPSRFLTPDASGFIELEVEQAEALYPITIDPMISFEQRLSDQALPPDCNNGYDYFGHSVDIDGNIAVIGADGEASLSNLINGNAQENAAYAVGAAYVFYRNPTTLTWSFNTYLKAFNADANDHFGYAVSVSGNTIAVGAYGEQSSGGGINGSNPNDDSIQDAGAVYIFVQDPSNNLWSQQAYLKARYPDAYDNFGKTLCLDGDTLVVGVPGDDYRNWGVDNSGSNGNNNNNMKDSGAVYVLTRSNGYWTQRAYAKSTNACENYYFGSSVDLKGNQFIVGSPNDASNALGVNGNQNNWSSPQSGAAAIFTYSNNQWYQSAYLKPQQSGSYNFGYSVAIDGNWACVAALGLTPGKAGVHCFRSNNGQWASDTILLSPANQGPSYSSFNLGHVLSLNGNTLAFGVSGDSSTVRGTVPLNNPRSNDQWNPSTGAVVLYTLAANSSSWNNLASAYFVKATNAAPYDHFGFAVALDGDDLLVAAPYRNKTNSSGDYYGGETYAYRRDAGTWSNTDALVGKIRAVQPQNRAGVQDGFGNAVSINGDLIAVGAPFDSSAAVGVNGNAAGGPIPYSGAVYLFARAPSGIWQLQAFLKASNPDPFDYFGTSVSVSGTTVVVGAVGESSAATGINGNQADNSARGAGAVYVFTSGAAWSQQAYLKASNAQTSDLFGWSVSLDGNDLAVSAIWEDSAATGINGNQADNSAEDAGAVYHFNRNGGNQWAQRTYIKASNTEANDVFGNHVSLNNGTLCVGAYLEDSAATGINGNQADNSAPDSGAAYVFGQNAGVWSQQAYIKASNTDSGDQFGWRVPINGDTLAISAYLEASSATGINGNQNDNSVPAAGAVYVWTRSNNIWAQQAYVKASNTAASQLFGFALDVNGNAMYAGAPGESSNATGVNGDQTNFSSPGSGAVYAFSRLGSVWGQFAYIKAPINAPNDQFGRACDANGGSVVIGEDRSKLNDDFSPAADDDGDAHTYRFSP